MRRFLESPKFDLMKKTLLTLLRNLENFASPLPFPATTTIPRYGYMDDG
jgi:hypothetical protein